MYPSPAIPIFLGRQPILDAAHTIVGYELLFRANPDDSSAELASSTAATAQVICTAFTDLNISEALAGLKAFINVDTGFLEGDDIELLPAEYVVLQLRATADAVVLARCRVLREHGYELAIEIDPHDPVGAPELLALASYLKIDVTATPPQLVEQAVAALARNASKLVAVRVETAAQAKQCAQQGFTYFQGNYFARPVIEEGRKLDPTTQGLLRLIQLVGKDVETHEIEEAFKVDPALTMNLLRLVNSAAMGMRAPISSIAHAINILGRRQLLRWLHLLLLRGTGGNLAANPLMLHAAMRGRIMELLAQRRYPDDRSLHESAFIVGVMSLMPAALRMPMKDVLEQIALAPAVRDAIDNYEGPLGQLLLLIEYYDDNNETGCRLSMQRIGEIDQNMLNNCLTQTLVWVHCLDT